MAGLNPACRFPSARGSGLLFGPWAATSAASAGRHPAKWTLWRMFRPPADWDRTSSNQPYTVAIRRAIAIAVETGSASLTRFRAMIPMAQTSPFNHPFFLLLNLAVGGTGSWPGPPDNTTPSPSIMTVDYVRSYTPSAVAGPSMSGPSISVKAGSPGSSVITLTSGTGRAYLSCTTTAPKAACSINSGDPLNRSTVDFSKTTTGTATVNLTTTANAA